jgi:integrase/recombinase XerD
MSSGRKKTKIRGLWVTARGHYSAKLWSDGQGRWVALGTDYAEAKRRHNALKAGEPIPSRVLLKDAVAGWLTYLESKRPNEKDRKLARVRTEQYLLKHFDADTRMGALSREHILKYRAWLDKQGRKPLTVQHILSDFRALLRWAEITGRVDRSPFVSRLVMPRIEEKAPKGLAPAEITALTSIPGDYGWTWRFLIGTGLRWSEATRALASHVQDGMLLVEKAKGKRVRRVPIAPRLLDEIRSRVGLLISFTSPGSFARTCGKLAGITGAGVHRARHTYAMRWVAEGGSLAALQEILGHRDLKTTQVYARVTDDLVRREGARVYAEQDRVPTDDGVDDPEQQKA